MPPKAAAYRSAAPVLGEARRSIVLVGLGVELDACARLPEQLGGVDSCETARERIDSAARAAATRNRIARCQRCLIRQASHTRRRTRRRRRADGRDHHSPSRPRQRTRATAATIPWKSSSLLEVTCARHGGLAAVCGYRARRSSAPEPRSRGRSLRGRRTRVSGVPGGPWGADPFVAGETCGHQPSRANGSEGERIDRGSGSTPLAGTPSVSVLTRAGPRGCGRDGSLSTAARCPTPRGRNRLPTRGLHHVPSPPLRR